MSLDNLGLSNEIVKALKEKGYQKATKIQEALIPAVLSGRDILAGAQTGTGKTAGFTLPILQALHKEYDEGKHIPKALILVPTRELARQVEESIREYGKYLPLTSVVLFGGANVDAQARALKKGADIIVSTTGRLLEHIEAKNISLENIAYLVLDEADTILDMGFVKEVSLILSKLPEDRQNIFISATLSGAVKRLADRILKRVQLIEVDSAGTSASNVEQVVYPVVMDKKLELLSFIIGARNYQQVLVFTRKKLEADMIVSELNLSGLKTAVIHGDKTSGARKRALEDFKAKKVRVLVATDIAARGLDIPSLSVVINYDIPHVIGDYIHRIGRTGRAGREGLAITLIAENEEVALKDVERLLGQKIPREVIKGYGHVAPVVAKGARKTAVVKKRVDGAFGKNRRKDSKAPTKKKRKTSKRDGFKGR